jgi:hypothetical protein
MRERGWFLANLLLATGFSLLFVFCASIAVSAGPKAMPAVRNAPKCTIDIADGKQSDCTLVHANHEWILWSNSAAKPRSVHFKSNENPFTETSCWDVAPGARGRSGPTSLSAALKTYLAYTSDAPCAANPPSDSSRGIIKVTVQ